MKRFSERVGAVDSHKSIQLEDMDAALKNSLWNEIYSIYEDEKFPPWVRVASSVAKDIYKIPVDTIGVTSAKALQWLRSRFFDGAWHETYDIVEYLHNQEQSKAKAIPVSLAQYSESARKATTLTRRHNHALERELSGYRFINNVLTPVANFVEVEAIENAISNLESEGMDAAQTHIAAALAFLGQKPNPDYRNSIKESISAVEALVNRIAGTEGNGVAVAIERISAKAPIHGALKSALKKLYGDTSDENGIRHSLMDESSIGYDEAALCLLHARHSFHFLSLSRQCCMTMEIRPANITMHLSRRRRPLQNSIHLAAR